VNVLLLGACLVGQATVQAAKDGWPAKWTYTHVLYQLTNCDWQANATQPGDRCVQFSSYDRRSDKADRDSEAWYANHDRGNYLRIEKRDGQDEHVMVDSSGPGVLTRLWSANPTGTLHFDIDGKRVWSVDFAALCSGKVDGVPAPLAAMRSRGGNVYLPVPFLQRLVVSSTQKDLYYLANVQSLPDGKLAEAWSPKLLQQYQPQVDRIAKGLARGTMYYTIPSSSVAGADRIVIPRSHGVIRLEVALKKGSGRADLARQLHGVRLVAEVGGSTTIDAPLPDFFATRDWRNWRGQQLGIRDGTAYCRWPMPMPEGGSIELVQDRPLQGVSLELRADLNPMLGEHLRFHASYHLVKDKPTRPFSDHLVLNATGNGRFVGCSLLVRNPSRIWWGEGDEKFYVDDETFPSWFGTGTEDYFGYAWCDPTPFDAPLHAQTRCDGPMNFGFTQLHRSHLPDSVPFQRSFRFDLERWHWVPDIKIDYATVAYWYGDKDATSGLPVVPGAEERFLEPPEPPKMFVANNALEGEALKVRSCSAGTHEIQNLSFFEGQFSRDAHRWWRDGKVGESMVLAVPVAEPGTYKVTLAMTRADDFAKVQVSLATKPLGEPFDGYAQTVSTSGPFVAGTIKLAAGTHDLKFEIVGKNPKAKNRMMVGLDYLILEKQ